MVASCGALTETLQGAKCLRMKFVSWLLHALAGDQVLGHSLEACGGVLVSFPPTPRSSPNQTGQSLNTLFGLFLNHWQAVNFEDWKIKTNHGSC